MEGQYDLMVSGGTVPAIMFLSANTLTAGTYTLKVQFTILSTDGPHLSPSESALVSNDFSIEVNVVEMPSVKLPNVPENNKTPSHDKLPYASSDIFGTDLKWSAYFLAKNGFGINRYKQVMDTYIVDGATCLFFSKWGLYPSGMQFHSQCGNNIRFDKAAYDSAGISAADGTTTVIITDDNDKNTARWSLWSAFDTQDSQCMPAPSGTSISGLAQSPNPATFSPSGSKELGLMFWLDETAADPKPARMRHSFYDDHIYGTVTSKDPAKDVGEYRVVIEPGSNTWSQKVQLIGSQASYNSGGTDVVEFGIYYRLRTCTALTSTSTPALCTGKYIGQKLFKSRKDNISSSSQDIIYGQKFYNTQDCIVFKPTVKVTNTTPLATGSITATFEFFDSGSTLHVESSGLTECQYYKLDYHIQPAAFPDTDLDHTYPELTTLFYT